MTADELTAARENATERLAELQRVARALWADRDDPAVMSELVSVAGQMRQARDFLRQTATTSAAHNGAAGVCPPAAGRADRAARC